MPTRSSPPLPRGSRPTRYDLRESVELAFVAALQHLPPTQRAVLILREVLGYSAQEVGSSLATTVAGVVAMLTEDAVISMPPLRSWSGGTREEFARFLELWPLSGKRRWKTRRTTANGQPAIGFYAYNAELGYNEPFALNVLTFRGELVSEVAAFVARATDLPADASYERWPDRPADPDWMRVAFGQFGLPDRL